MKIFILFLLITSNIFSQSQAFITTWDTGTEKNIIIPTTGSGYNYTVDWGDGTIETNIPGTIEHNYDVPGLYTVKITGDFPQIFFNSSLTRLGGNLGNALKIRSIEQWGSIEWRSMKNAFSGCVSLKSINATDAPNLSKVTDMSEMFADNYLLNATIGHWDVSNVTNMRGLFREARKFNNDLNNWNVSKVTDMKNLFKKALSFNGNLSKWNVQSVKDMSNMFELAVNFNQDISEWDVANVTTMKNMFYRADVFNQSIGNWNVSNVTTMENMFHLASSFNKNISDWNVSNVTTMQSMFFNAIHFDQNIGSWDISNVINMSNMLDFTNISIANYDTILKGWSTSAKSNRINLGATGLIYCDAKSARNTLINTHNWTILNDVNDCNQSSFITIWQTNRLGKSNDNQITIPTIGDGYNYTVNWGDGKSDTAVTGDITHTYDQAGIYSIQITGDFPRINFNNFDNFTFEEKDNHKLLVIRQWGKNPWISFKNAFDGCKNLNITADDSPNLSSVKSTVRMLSGTRLSRADNIESWNVTNITEMNYMFEKSTFNHDISMWDVSNVTNMEGMFFRSSFNQNIGNWDIQNVKDLSFMFTSSTFNQDISKWDTSNVTNITNLFYNNAHFNQDISKWDINNIKSMEGVFGFATSFNQNIGLWDVSNVTSLSGIFKGATSFDQDLSSWDIRNVGLLVGVFDDSGLSTTNYDKVLKAWAELVDKGLPDNLYISARGLTYCTAEAARQKLINHGFKIEGDTNDCSTLSILDPIFKEKKPIKLYPIPTTKELFVDTSILTTNTSYQIMSISGKNVMSGKLSKANNSINVTSIDTGIYFLQLQTSSNFYAPIKFIKQ
ncbi:BspA family leucine-rich repeat surface protein [Aquimarina agarilytica]|uniref:BspA family leucine-rich repeat surface protein n=1 Tax=Aquimarina agarilytica TaxID=1087449 RepID=UPI000287AD77|nr:BspA family leucine-rich repeat surface protein [Aquimarina agarilytica]